MTTTLSKLTIIQWLLTESLCEILLDLLIRWRLCCVGGLQVLYLPQQRTSRCNTTQQLNPWSDAGLYRFYLKEKDCVWQKEWHNKRCHSYMFVDAGQEFCSPGLHLKLESLCWNFSYLFYQVPISTAWPEVVWIQIYYVTGFTRPCIIPDLLNTNVVTAYANTVVSHDTAFFTLTVYFIFTPLNSVLIQLSICQFALEFVWTLKIANVPLKRFGLSIS